MVRERTAGVIEEAVLDLTLRGYAPAQIHRELAPIAKKHLLAVPSLRTVQRIARRAAPPDPSGPWRLWAGEGIARAHPELVAPVLAGVMEATEGRVEVLTNRSADWIATIRIAAPALPPWPCYVLARRYVAFEAGGRDTGQLDQVVALANRFIQAASFELTHYLGPDDPELHLLLGEIVFTARLSPDGSRLKVEKGAIDEIEEVSDEPQG